jgi:hypothetical protein
MVTDEYLDDWQLAVTPLWSAHFSLSSPIHHLHFPSSLTRFCTTSARHSTREAHLADSANHPTTSTFHTRPYIRDLEVKRAADLNSTTEEKEKAVRDESNATQRQDSIDSCID